MNISECASCGECFLVAISLENAVRAYYLRMAELFHLESEAAQTFLLMAQDESGHASTLEKVRDSGAHPPSIHENAPLYVQNLRSLLERVEYQTTRRPANLEVAWRFALDFEKGEVNHIYIALTAPSMRNPHDGDLYVSTILKTHVQKLVDLGACLDKETRLGSLPIGG